MTEEVKTEDAKVAVSKVRESINKIKDSLIAIKENPTPENIGGIILTLYLLSMATANAIVYPYLVTWLVIVLPILLLLTATAFVLKKEGSTWETVWAFLSWFAQGMVIFIALATNIAAILLMYSLPMYLFYRIINKKINERNSILSSKIHTMVQEAKA